MQGPDAVGLTKIKSLMSDRHYLRLFGTPKGMCSRWIIGAAAERSIRLEYSVGRPTITIVHAA